MSTNGSHPPQPVRRLPGSRRVHLAVGVATAIVLAAVLVAPLVLLGTGAKHTADCRTRILYRKRHYVAHPTTRVVEAIAVGVGVATGCGTKPANVDLRSVAGIKPAFAVALASDPATVYVRAGVCPHAVNVLRCLKSRAAVAATGSLPQ